MKIEDLSLYSLKYFFDAVETGSLTEASRLNFVTRSAVSQSINRLEEWASAPLCTHQKRKFELTKEGEDFYRTMRLAFSQFQAMVDGSHGTLDKIRVGCSASLVDVFLIPALKKLNSLNELHLVTGTSNQIAYRLKEGEINLALSINAQDPPLENSFIVHSGVFVLAIPKGGDASKIITTESRREVSELKNHFVKSKKQASFLTVESWTIALKIATELELACLVPDFMMPKNFSHLPLRGFRASYDVRLEHAARENLTSLELRLLEAFQVRPQRLR